MLGNCFVRFLASWRLLDEASMPKTSLADFAAGCRRKPVPQPTSSTTPFWLSLVLFKAASILAFCSSRY